MHAFENAQYHNNDYSQTTAKTRSDKQRTMDSEGWKKEEYHKSITIQTPFYWRVSVAI